MEPKVVVAVVVMSSNISGLSAAAVKCSLDLLLHLGFDGAGRGSSGSGYGISGYLEKHEVLAVREYR